jgi:hypothetical protein
VTLRGSFLFSFTGALFGLWLHAGTVSAAPKDAEAQKIAQDAIDTDYLGTDFEAAANKLKQALALCKGGACSPKVVAKIRSYLGIVYVAQEKRDEGEAEFVAALESDPGLVLDPDLTNPEVKQVFESAKSSAGEAGGEEEETEEEEPEPEEEIPGEEGDEDPKRPNIADYKPSGKITSSMEAECPPDAPPDFPGCEDEEEDGEKSDEKPPAAKNFVSLGIQQDFLLVSSGTGVCSGGNEYSCFIKDTDEYFLRNEPRREAFAAPGNEISGGFARATIRILAGYDRLFGDNLTAGARLGFAFGGGPQAPGGAAFIPIHFEVRGAYWFGDRPFSKPGVRPYATLGGGLMQVDAKVPVAVFVQDTNPLQRAELDAWKKAGTQFAFLGGGAMYAITATHGPHLEAKYLQMFGAGSSGFALQLGYVVGF